MTKLTAQRLRELLHYSPDTGVFTWRVSRGGAVCAGDSAGYGNGAGYRKIYIDGGQYMAHRLAWLYTHGSWPSGVIDHRDGDRSNNAIANIRDVSICVNNQNQKRAHSSNRSCGLLGVTRDSAGMWQARIRVDGKRRYLGTFKDQEQAGAAYIAAKRLLHAGCTI